MRLFRGKLATDKPIEIFIALFVILAVAMVILKMFSSQIEQKKTEMEQQQQEQRAFQAMADLDTYCDSQCSKAFRSLKDKVAYCTSYYREEIDINKNSMPDYTMALDNIQGFCEDRIYCAAYRTCGSLDMQNCKKVVCQYLEDTLGLESDYDMADRLVGYDGGTYTGLFQPGECWYRISDEEKKYHWFNNFLSVEDPLGTTCSLLVGTCYERRGEFEADPDFSQWITDGTWEQECVIFD
jgi:hypothetical protein